MGSQFVDTRDESLERGRSLRKAVPRSSHGEWWAAFDRPDPVALIEGQNSDRLQTLVPVRRARMAESPFAFFRGAARIMAHDLARTPATGLTAQICGDAHLSNFGAYASPERRLVFDLNDFDETLPGPWEWDVKRFAASLVIAGQHEGLTDEHCRDLVADSIRAYRETMRRLSNDTWLQTWYMHISFDELADLAEEKGVSKKRQKKLDEFAAKARSKNHLRAARKLLIEEDGRYRFRSDPPLLIPLRELPDTQDVETFKAAWEVSFDGYRQTLDDNVRHLLDRYKPVDGAVKVVGVGSVGTRCSVVLLVGKDRDDVLLLQIKEATKSVLEEHLPASRYETSGQRVVEGQRMMQSLSDIFLGWNRSAFSGHHYYWRQLKDWKGSFEIEDADRKSLERYARLCGLTLARAHAVTGEPGAISGYLGKGSNFDRALAEFAVRYAAQNAEDHAAFVAAIEGGDLEAREVE